MDNGFQFGDRCSRDFDMYVQHRPKQQIAARRGKTFTVPGRSCTIHQMEYAWNSIVRTYDCYFHSARPMPEQAHAIKAWLCGGTGPQRLRDAYDPNYYYLAMCISAVDMENHLNRYGVVKVKFECDPRAFLVSGDEPVRFCAAGALYNPTGFVSQPMVTVYGAGSGNLHIGGTAVEIQKLDDQIILDCERMDAYRQIGDGPRENKNAAISAPVFPRLQPGENEIRWDGGITGLEIVPRWWTL